MSYAKNNLSRLLALVRGGKQIVIADRGVPVAILSPVTGATAPADEALESLVRAGLVTVGTAHPAEAGRDILASPPPRPRHGAGAVARLVSERRSGW
ncbi:MAG: type II toxin-antitoxin system Phd/YefM family antitoxin [Gemmatimonadaceae bacterium]